MLHRYFKNSFASLPTRRSFAPLSLPGDPLRLSPYQEIASPLQASLFLWPLC